MTRGRRGSLAPFQSQVTVNRTIKRQPDCISPGVGRIGQFVLLTVSLATVDATVTQPRHAHPYRDHWKHSTFGKRALGGVAAGPGVEQRPGNPRIYGGGAGGLGNRLGADS